jgi:hypothetical protein
MLFQMPGDDVTCGGVKTHGVKILFKVFQGKIYRPLCVLFIFFFVRENFLNVYLFCVLFLSAGGVEGLRVYTKLFHPLTAINTFRCDPL